MSTVVPEHAPWCGNQAAEHAACTSVIAVVEPPYQHDVQIVVGLHRARGVAGFVSMTVRIGGRETMLALGADPARVLASGLATAASMLLKAPL